MLAFVLAVFRLLMLEMVVKFGVGVVSVVLFLYIYIPVWPQSSRGGLLPCLRDSGECLSVSLSVSLSTMVLVKSSLSLLHRVIVASY